jgi:hypothetical protein
VALPGAHYCFALGAGKIFPERIAIWRGRKMKGNGRNEVEMGLKLRE